MAHQLQALIVACVLAMTPMLLTQTIELVPVVTTVQMDAPQWALYRIADYSNCSNPQTCQQNFRDVLQIYCIAFTAWTPVAGAVCTVTAIF